ncbi:unannotated protein [freshwater metagenome]|uniref:Unannotated protein n=1 Tax=freshwater metagenome TaxID=449393 RepID=A0A6J6SMB7_9ZZZZ
MRRESELDLRARREEQDRGLGSIGDDVCAPTDTGHRLLGRDEGRQVLAGEDEADRLAARERGVPGSGGLVCIGRTYDAQARNRPQRPEVLDRLMGWSILAEPDGVVGPHERARQLHERREAHRAAHIVAEHHERTAERPGEAVEGDAVDDRAHRVLADAEVEDAAVRRRAWQRGALRQEAAAALDRRVVGLGQVS